METERSEYKIAMSVYRRDHREMQALVYRMLGKYQEPKSPLKQRRREIAKQLDGLLVSRMIIEAR